MKILHGLRAYLRPYPKKLKVVATWDQDAGVWYVSDSNVPGLSTEADSIENLIEKLRVMIPEMLILNGILPEQDRKHLEVPYELMTRQLQSAQASC